VVLLACLGRDHSDDVGRCQTRVDWSAVIPTPEKDGAGRVFGWTRLVFLSCDWWYTRAYPNHTRLSHRWATSWPSWWQLCVQGAGTGTAAWVGVAANNRATSLRLLPSLLESHTQSECSKHPACIASLLPCTSKPKSQLHPRTLFLSSLPHQPIPPRHITTPHSSIRTFLHVSRH
jgi:hypothetical protein